MENNIENIETLDTPVNANLGTPIMPNATTLNSTVESLEGPTVVTLENNIPDPNLIKPAPVPEEKPKKKGGALKFILITLAFIVILIGGFTAYKLFLIKPTNIYNNIINKLYTFTSSKNISFDQANGNFTVKSSNEEEINYVLDYSYLTEQENIQTYLELKSNEQSLLNLKLYKYDNKLYIKNSSDELYYIMDFTNYNVENFQKITQKISNIIIQCLNSNNFKRSISFDNKMLSLKNTLTMSSDDQTATLVNILLKIKEDSELLSLIVSYLSDYDDTYTVDDIKELIQDIIDNINEDPLTTDTLNIDIYTSVFTEKIVGIKINDILTYVNKSGNINLDIKDVLQINGTKDKLNINLFDSFSGTYTNTNGNITLELKNDALEFQISTKDYLNYEGYLVYADALDINFENKLEKTSTQTFDKLDVSKAKQISYDDLEDALDLDDIDTGITDSTTNSDLLDNATSLVVAANEAYGDIKNTLSFKSGDSKNICFDVEYLKNKGYYTGNEIKGSVLIKESGDKLFWITDNKNYYEVTNINDDNPELKSGTIPSTISTCGGSLSVKATCFGTSCTVK